MKTDMIALVNSRADARRAAREALRQETLFFEIANRAYTAKAARRAHRRPPHRHIRTSALLVLVLAILALLGLICIWISCQ